MCDIKHQLTDEEAKFCLLFVNAPAPYNGDARACYDMVFGSARDEFEQAEHLRLAKELLDNEEVKERIAELQAVDCYNAASLKPRITETLLKIMSEMSVCQYYDKDGIKLSPASARSVAVNAAKELNSMYGVKEEIVHKVKLQNDSDSGITFNVIMPEKRKDFEKELDDDSQEEVEG